ncbi:MAG: PEP-CTERM sorting domain-containing protein [Verrucomicrobiota bacterium]
MLTSLRYFIAAAAAAGSLGAQVLMLDFGPTVADGSSLTDSPYHSADGDFADDGWNTITDSSGQSGTFAPVSDLLWSDGSAASGITLDVAAGASAGSTSMDLDRGFIQSLALGTNINTGVYADNSVAKDGIFIGSSTGNAFAVGFQISGLAAGDYEIYLTGRNTNLNNASTTTFHYATSATSGDFNFSGYDSQTLSYESGTTDATSSWVVGENFVKLSFTITSGDVLNIAVLGGGGDSRGFLSSAQIVYASIPEPASAGLLAGVGLLGFAAIRRRGRTAA